MRVALDGEALFINRTTAISGLRIYERSGLQPIGGDHRIKPIVVVSLSPNRIMAKIIDPAANID